MERLDSTQLLNNDGSVYSEERNRFLFEYLALVVLKPTSNNNIEGEILDRFASVVENEKLHVLHSEHVLLSSDQVKTMYQPIFEDRDDISPEDASSYRGALIEYMTEAPCRVFVLYGQSARAAVERFKEDVRSNYGTDFSKKYLKNFVHVPEDDEYEQSLRALFSLQ